MRIDGFAYRRVGANGIEHQVAVGGAGTPVLLLHGFPENHLAWRHVAPRLAEEHTVVCTDLRGYGGSDRPAVDTTQRTYAKRTMALDAVALMTELGYPRFHVVGHDRGGLVAFRLGLDHPGAVASMTAISTIPGLDLWDTLRGSGTIFAWHLPFLAQPGDLAERMVAALPEAFYGSFLEGWSTTPETVPADVRQDYLAPLSTPDGIRAVCADHRAGALIDPADDAADRAAGRLLRMPTMAIWPDPAGTALPFDPYAVWSGWTRSLRTEVMPGGHLLPEEQPERVAEAVLDLAAKTV
jgi:haloacetate dehalogenase